MNSFGGQMISKTQNFKGTAGNANAAALAEILINYPFGHVFLSSRLIQLFSVFIAFFERVDIDIEQLFL